MTITRLTKPVRRRMGDLVIEMHAEGIRIRRYRQRGGRTIKYTELARHFPPATASRKEAFDLPRPAGWLPIAGDRVWIAPLRGTMGRLVAAGTVERVIDCVGGPLVRVKARYGRRFVSDQYLIDNLRPAPDD